MRGHFWTLKGHIGRTLKPEKLPSARHLALSIDAGAIGTVRLSARLSVPSAATSLLILAHGLGGSSQSPYLFPAVNAAHALGIATLRLNLRGADLRGEDFYHAGLTDDVRSWLAHPQLSEFSRIALLGYSLGGHLCLRCASESLDPRLVAISSLCAPLDLDQSAAAFDSARFGLYRAHVLRSLKAMYRQVANKRPVSLATTEVDRISSIRQWDEQIVAPRHGFQSAVDYYAQMSAGPKLGQIELPTLLAYAEEDPVVPPRTFHGALARCSQAVQIWKIPRGGHIGFPTGPTPHDPSPNDIVPHTGSVDVQLVHWLVQHLS
ncbi:MAG TPA: alpha/beta fold hydrolase [Polyangiaceae bacterium]|nr:alpha/beta fold hydrolase [Polyangiaceae bacterium]